MKKIILPLVLSLSLASQNLNGLEKNLIEETPKIEDKTSYIGIEKELKVVDCIPLNKNYELKFRYKIENTFLSKPENMHYWENFAVFMQNSLLVEEDIYTYTKTGLALGAEEGNPIANEFWKNNLWDQGFLAAETAQALGNYFAYKIDESGNFAKIINSLVGIGEVLAAYTWEKPALKGGKEEKDWKEKFPKINAKAEIIIITW